ncbi:DUF2599 domain-containing protein [Microbacterium luticocti]|uniref:DUF2599 domain-containing protein n=1 Tax=Microbacterium luticocti TaxID=451764 RepID=UPI00048E10A9|nr:DUF2599 domain-containing protein [Microbacterium luticocti]
MKPISMAASAVVVAAVLAAGAPALASETTGDDPSVVDQLAHAAPELAAVMAAPSDTSSKVGEVTATVSDDTIAITSDSGMFTTTAPDAAAGSTIQSVLLDEASALFAISLENETAPRAYDFAVDLPTGAEATITESGAVVYAMPDGEFLGGVASPWAKDAAGKTIPTWYTFADGVLTQHVDLDSVTDITYPVIADPLNGKWLVAAAWVTYQSNSSKYVVNAQPTAFGRDVLGIAYLNQHTADLKARLGTLANKVTSTINNQFHCHVQFNYIGGGATYNMESWRKDIPWWWPEMVASKCNP